MIAVTPAVAALLSSGQEFFFADLYTFHLLNGQVLRYNSADADLTWAGSTWSGNSLRIERGKIKLVRGVQVDELKVDIYPKSDDLVQGNPFVQLAVNGGLDGCYLQLDRAVGPSPVQPITGIVPKRFYGRIADIDGGRSKLELTVKSDLDLLNIQMPRVLFQAPCSHSLYDGGCTLLRAAFSTTAAISGGSSTTVAFNTTLAQADRYFERGVINFTSGPNNAISRTIKTYSNGSGAITILLPLPAAPTAGDTFVIYPGCDKTFATCTGKFANGQNYRGFEFIPNPETSFM